MNDLVTKRCAPQRGKALSRTEAERFLEQVIGWTIDSGGKELRRAFRFKDYHAAIAFVNAVAGIAERQDHHPEMTVGYDTVTVAFSTHSVGGLSENDFICAAKIDALGAA